MTHLFCSKTTNQTPPMNPNPFTLIPSGLSMPLANGGPSRRIALTATALLLLVGAPAARAASDAWDGSVDGTWATSANWLTDPLTVPGTGDTATFNGAGNGNTTINLG